mgnify:CR=1 FL=1
MDKRDTYFNKVSTNGRPKLVLNEAGIQAIEDLSGYMCTREEIAAFLGCQPNTLVNEENKELFEETFKRGQENCKASLRRKQFEVGMKGHAVMLIWLGKQYLGQAEKLEAAVANDDEKLEEMKKFMETVKYGKKEN